VQSGINRALGKPVAIIDFGIGTWRTRFSGTQRSQFAGRMRLQQDRFRRSNRAGQ
jgi:hypothetical protein